MAYVDFIETIHRSTPRDYVGRVNEADKAECSEKAIQFGKDYWDGERKYGYGGYRYDGRWNSVAQKMADHYKLEPGARILDVGCGKGFLLYEFGEVVKDAKLHGIDISRYAIENAKPEVKPFVQVGNAVELPIEDNSMDFVVSITTLHNLYNYDLDRALREIERVSKGPAHINVEAYRNEREKMNLMYWQLTCRAFHSPEEWEWIFKQSGYTGDHSFIFFE